MMEWSRESIWMVFSCIDWYFVRNLSRMDEGKSHLIPHLHAKISIFRFSHWLWLVSHLTSRVRISCVILFERFCVYITGGINLLESRNMCENGRNEPILASICTRTLHGLICARYHFRFCDLTITAVLLPRFFGVYQKSMWEIRFWVFKIDASDSVPRGFKMSLNSFWKSKCVASTMMIKNGDLNISLCFFW